MVSDGPPQAGKWIAVDLDGVLACDDEKNYELVGVLYIGAPIAGMVQRVRAWVLRGWEVRVFTSRATLGQQAIASVEEWCHKYLGFGLPITATKDYGMVEMWDDLAVRVKRNTGELDEVA